MGRYHYIQSKNNNNDKSNSQSYFSELASLYKDNTRKPLIDLSKPLFGHKSNSLQKLLANANKTTEEAKSRQLACTNRSKSIPENATIRKEYIKCGKEMCEQNHGPYYYAYWKDPESKKLKKKYIGDQYSKE